MDFIFWLFMSLMLLVIAAFSMIAYNQRTDRIREQAAEDAYYRLCRFIALERAQEKRKALKHAMLGGGYQPLPQHEAGPILPPPRHPSGVTAIRKMPTPAEVERVA